MLLTVAVYSMDMRIDANNKSVSSQNRTYVFGASNIFIGESRIVSARCDRLPQCQP